MDNTEPGENISVMHFLEPPPPKKTKKQTET